MIIQHNITALNAYNRLSTNNSTVSKNLEKLSSGYRINRAGDDAAGLAISEKMRAQITGLERATLNAQDGISLVQTAEGALTEVHSMLNRMVELGTQSANGTYQAEDRQKIQSEVDALLSEVDRISQATNFNGINLLDGSLGLDTDAFKAEYSQAITAGGLTTVSNIKTSTTSQAASKGTYDIDLGDLNLEIDQSGSFVIEIDNKQITVAIGNGVTEDLDATAKGDLTGYAIKTDVAVNASTMRTKLVSIITNALSDAAGIKVGGQIVTVANQGTNAIRIQQATAPDNASKVIDIGKNFDITGNVTGSVQHDVRVVTESKAASAATRAEADIKIDVSSIGNGATLTIGDKTFTFLTKDSGKTSATANKGEIDLLAYSENDLRAMDKDVLAVIAGKAVSKAVYATGAPAITDWDVSLKEDGSLHLDQKVGNSADYSTKANVLSSISSTTIAKSASVSIDIDDSLLRNGSSVKIGDKLYEFTNNAANLKNEGAVAVVVAGLSDSGNSSTVGTAATALAAAAGGNVPGNNAQRVTISASAGNAAPTIAGTGLTLQIGDTADKFNQVTVAVDDMGTVGLGINGLKVTDQGWSQESIDKIKASIEKVSVNRGNLGALQNRLDHTINNLTTTAENMTAAESRVRDTDMAKEMMDFTKNNVLVQAAQAMLAQANQQPQQVLQLLR